MSTWFSLKKTDEFDQTKLVLSYKAFKVLFRKNRLKYYYLNFCELPPSDYTGAKKDMSEVTYS